jgi:hypothetical protein
MEVLHMQKLIRALTITTALFGLSIAQTSLCYAEEIRIPVGEQAADAPQVDMPTTGMTQARVETLFGEPIEKTVPRGKPPISSWKYSEFIVYFEYDHVIHSVRAFHPNTNTAVLEE